MNREETLAGVIMTNQPSSIVVSVSLDGGAARSLKAPTARLFALKHCPVQMERGQVGTVSGNIASQR